MERMGTKVTYERLLETFVIKRNFRLNGIDILIFCLGLESSAPSGTHAVLNEKNPFALCKETLSRFIYIQDMFTIQ